MGRSILLWVMVAFLTVRGVNEAIEYGRCIEKGAAAKYDNFRVACVDPAKPTADKGGE